MEIFIFSFGLVVVLIVGSGLVSHIVAKNRALNAEQRAEPADSADSPSPSVAPARRAS